MCIVSWDALYQQLCIVFMQGSKEYHKYEH